VNRPPPFRLLAITPPTGAVDPSAVTRWCGAAEVGVAVLLREVTTPRAALDRNGRLHALAELAREQGLPVLWSVDCATLLRTPADALQRVDGVQLRGDPSASELARARDHLGHGWIGRSVHGGPVQAPPGQTPAADYAVFAPVFSPRTTTVGRSSKKAAGVQALRAWAGATRGVFALGGVGAATAAACVTAGAWGLASIHAFFGAADVEHEVAAMAAALRPTPP